MATQEVDVLGGTDGGRFATYVAELREFCVGRGIKFGAPEDLAGFVAVLREPGTLSEELGSLTRSVLYREQGAVALPELLEIITVAIGGPGIAEAGEQVRESVRDLLVFIGKALRNKRELTLLEPVGTKAKSYINATDAERPQTSVNSEPDPAAMQADAAVVETASAAATVPHPHPVSDLYVRARGLLQAEETSLASSDHEQKLERGVISPEERDACQLGGEPPPAVNLSSSELNRGRGHGKPPSPLTRKRNVLAICFITVAALVFLFIFARPWVRPARGTTRNAAITAMGPAHVDNRATGRPKEGVKPGAANGGSAAVTVPLTAGSAKTRLLTGEATADAPVRPESNFSNPEAVVAHAAGEDTSLNRRDQVTPEVSHSTAEDGGQIRSADSADLGAGTASSPLLGERSRSSARVTPAKKLGLGPRGGAYTVTSGVMGGHLISAPPPEYPRLAGMMHLEGQVILQAVVSRNGRVVATHVLRGHRLLRSSAEKAVRQWRYRPFFVNGQPTDVATIVTVNFQRR